MWTVNIDRDAAERAALECISRQDWTPAARARFMRNLRKSSVIRSRTARGALVLAYVAPFIARKPRPNENPTEGWISLSLSHHILPECDGVWWVPREAVPHMLEVSNTVAYREGDDLIASRPRAISEVLP